MEERDIVIVGGGAAGFFAALACAEAAPRAQITILEKSPRFLSKVRISGGGRCNVTHALYDPRQLSEFYPRGGAALQGPFTVFQPRDTVSWFESRGIKLKTEADGRIFPTTDSSETIIQCFLHEARNAGLELLTNQGLDRVERRPEGGFELALTDGSGLKCGFVLLATGGSRSAAAVQFVAALGHTNEPPVPSLFTFHIDAPWLGELAGISVDPVQASVPACGLREQGAVLITHMGLSGPAILRLSAWGARAIHEVNYEFALRLNWLPLRNQQTLDAEIEGRRKDHPARLIINTPIPPLAVRLWEALVLASGVPRETRWAELSRPLRHRLVQHLLGSELQVVGRSLNKDEFVTCGGVRLSEVNFKTMQSRVCPGLYFAGELLDIDGLTGGFNFQAAWTTGWIAGRAMGAAYNSGN